MKAVHKNRNDGEEEAGSWLDKAKDLEQQGELEKAAAAFEKVIKENPANELAYDRLMIICRKQKEFKKELDVIKTFPVEYSTKARLPGKFALLLTLFTTKKSAGWARSRTLIIRKVNNVIIILFIHLFFWMIVFTDGCQSGVVNQFFWFFYVITVLHLEGP